MIPIPILTPNNSRVRMGLGKVTLLQPEISLTGALPSFFVLAQRSLHLDHEVTGLDCRNLLEQLENSEYLRNSGSLE